MKEERQYICDFCGHIFSDKASCKRHEKMCQGNKLVRVNLVYDGFKYLMWADEPKSYDVEYPLDQLYLIRNSCDSFSMFTENISQEGVKACKSKLIKDAISWIEDRAKTLHEYVEKLRSNKILDEPYKIK